MHGPAIQTSRPRYCLAPQPAREMSRRGLALVIGIYVVLFGTAALRIGF